MHAIIIEYQSQKKTRRSIISQKEQRIAYIPTEAFSSLVQNIEIG